MIDITSQKSLLVQRAALVEPEIKRRRLRELARTIAAGRPSRDAGMATNTTMIGERIIAIETEK
jgi:hypothetical protein